MEHDYVIRKRGSQWCVLTADESRVLGCHDTEADAQAQLRAVEASKHMATELKGIEVFAAGIHNGDPYTTNDLDSMVTAFKEAGITPPYKQGHTKDPGAPAIGWIKNLYRAGSRLLADISDVPKEVYDAIKARRFGTHSAEVVWDAEVGGKKYPKFLKGVALLGADVPAVPNLKPAWESIQGLKWTSERTYAFDVEIPNGGDGAKELQVTVAQMATMCPPCAEKMQAMGFKAIKLQSADGGKTYVFPGGMPEEAFKGLCDKFSPDEGFRARCMDSGAAANVTDPGAFCNALKTACKDQGMLTMSGGGKTMDDKDKLIAELQAKNQELDAALKSFVEGDEDKGFGAVAIGKLRKDLEEKQAKLAALTEEQRVRDIAGKVASLNVPVFRKYFAALYEAATVQGAKTVQFSMDGKTPKPTVQVEVLDLLIKSINRQTDHLFKELALVGGAGADREEISEDAGVEVDRRTRKYMAEKAEKDYEVAKWAVLGADPELAQQYASGGKTS